MMNRRALSGTMKGRVKKKGGETVRKENVPHA
jgi:hypothetical protein